MRCGSDTNWLTQDDTFVTLAGVPKMKPTPDIQAKILLIDDCRNGLLVRTALLEDMGCQVEMACNGEEGLKLFDRYRFDIVVTDYRMPGMSGLEVIGKIRERDPQARIILVSTMAEPLGLNEENTGADAVIAKSFNEASLLPRTVKRLLTRPVRKPLRSHRSRPVKTGVGVR
jgi:phosphoserine phosphatase RsbU/P